MKLITAVLALGMFVGVAGQVHAAKPSRTVRVSYTNATQGYQRFVNGYNNENCAGEDSIDGCVSTAIHSGERFLTVEVTDTTGQPVFVWVGFDTNNDGDFIDEYLTPFCASTEKPIKIGGRYFNASKPPRLAFFKLGSQEEGSEQHRCPLPATGAATTGTLDVTFLRRP